MNVSMASFIRYWLPLGFTQEIYRHRWNLPAESARFNWLGFGGWRGCVGVDFSGFSHRGIELAWPFIPTASATNLNCSFDVWRFNRRQAVTTGRNSVKTRNKLNRPDSIISKHPGILIGWFVCCPSVDQEGGGEKKKKRKKEKEFIGIWSFSVMRKRQMLNGSVNQSRVLNLRWVNGLRYWRPNRSCRQQIEQMKTRDPHLN